MKRSLRGKTLPLFLSLSALICSLCCDAQKTYRIDWSKDTISSTNANNAQRNFANALNGTGKKASSVINLPVDKMKDIMDACSANGIATVKVMVVSIRQEDVEHYEKNNPGISATDKTDLVGRQTLVIRVPRRAFAGAAGSGIKVPKNNPILTSLLASGFFPFAAELAGMPAGGGDDIFFSFGQICPPPNSCD
ncbi:MAG TPA: hypothetical protein VLJ68_02450 [Chitinophagaceae bacterium]|nr:hypothetical protein [Chitinophagaceae bacterium]